MKDPSAQLWQVHSDMYKNIRNCNTAQKMDRLMVFWMYSQLTDYVDKLYLT